jgi:hypothetical protein
MLKSKNFFSKECPENKNYCNPQGDFRNDFVSRKIGKADVVVDRATGLMWIKKGSAAYFEFKKAEKYVRKLNSKVYAGYSDWRLPTLEEAASLLENRRKRNRYIDPVFSMRPIIWTGDKFDGEIGWVVNFVAGRVAKVKLDNDKSLFLNMAMDDFLYEIHARAVRKDR